MNVSVASYKVEIDNYEFMVIRKKQRNGEYLWSVHLDEEAFAISRDLKFEHERLPSNRTDEYLKNTRFSLDEAFEICKKFYEKDKDD